MPAPGVSSKALAPAPPGPPHRVTGLVAELAQYGLYVAPTVYAGGPYGPPHGGTPGAWAYPYTMGALGHGPTAGAYPCAAPQAPGRCGL